MTQINWLRWPLEHYSISLLIVGILFVMGIYGMYIMPKDEFPHATIRQGVVVAVYPGATSEEVEQQVARPLERYLFTFGEVNRVKTTTQSQNGMCIVMVKLNDDVNNKDEVWSKIKHGLNGFKAQLPSGVLAIVVNDDFGNTSALLIAIESDQRSYRELKQYSDDLSDRLRRIPSVANVKLFGEQKEQISLYIDRQRLQAYGIGQQMLFSRLQAQGITTMSGSISDDDQQIPIHVEAQENSEEEIANQIIFSDPATGKVARVRDVARVVREYEPMSSRIEQDGHPCLLLSMEMTPGNNVVQYGQQVEQVLSSFAAEELPEDVKVTRIADKPKVVAKSVSDFLRDLLISMLIIILVMMVLFPIRSAIVAAITIPLSTFVSVAIMYMMGIELNIVTLAALIVVLGMIVDNSIVVIDGYLEYLGKGFKPFDAAIESARQYFMPMLLATICICAIFYPFLITMKGMFHDCLEDFPVTITINLMVSLVLAVTVIPYLETKLIKRPTPQPLPVGRGVVTSSADNTDDKTIYSPPSQGGAGGGSTITKWVQRTYDKVLDWTFAHPWLTIYGGIGVILLSTLIAPTLKIRLFPFADRDQFAVEIFLPDGKGLAETRMVTDSVRHVLEKDERITSITGFIGCSSPRFMDAYAPQMAGNNYAQFIVNTKSDKATIDLLAKYQPQLSEAFPNAYVKFKRLDYLEVSELEYRFYGDNLDSLHVVAERLMEHMRKMPELEWVHTDYFQPYPIINVELDPVTSAQLGITRTTAQLALSATSSDLRVGQIWEDNYELPIVVKDDTDMTFSDIANLGIASPASMVSGGVKSTNSTVPLRQIAKVQPKWSESRIMHRGGERCITVTAQFVQGVYTAPIEKKIARVMQEEIELPQGVRTEVGGEIEYGDEALPQIFGGIAIAEVIVFFFLLFNFKRYGITTICMVALGLMTPGALIGLGLMNRALGLTSIFGLITLMGMIMRNEILIFEHANDLIKKGVPVKQAAYEAGKRRMVPIFLTTATTAVGVVPMIIAQSSFWMPVGVTIFAGGIGSLIMVVTMLPVIYWKISAHPKPLPKGGAKDSPNLKQTMKILFFLFALLPTLSLAQVTNPPSLEEGKGVGLTLEQLKDSALHNNIAIRNARHNIETAQQQRKEAFTKYFPNVNGTGLWFNANKGMAQTTINPSEMISPELGASLAQMLPAEALAALANPISISMMKNGTIGSLIAVQPIFAGGQIINGNKLAKVGEDVSRLQLLLSENEVEKTAEQYFWQLASLQEKMKTIEAVDTLLRDIFKDVDVAVRAGLAMRNDLLQVQLRQNDIESQRLKLQNGISIVRLLLSQYCGLRDTSFVITYQSDAPSALLSRQDHDQALLGTAEYQLLGKQVEAANLQKKLAVGQNLPSVAVGAGYNYHNLLESNHTFGMVFASVSVPISDWWGGSHAIKRRKIEHQQAQEQLADNAEMLKIRMQNAWNGVQEAYQQLQLAKRSIEQAEENLRLNRDYYRAGTSRMSDLLEAQLLYQQSLDKHIDAFADYQNKLLEYRQNIGQ